jgi:hypothetical protein
MGYPDNFVKTRPRFKNRVNPAPKALIIALSNGVMV